MLGIAGQIHDMIDNALKLDSKHKKPLYGSKTNCIKLSKTQLPDFDCLQMITDIYQAMREVKIQNPKRPSMNWSWPTRKEQDFRSTSDEVCLERELIRRGHKDWAYQIPTSSGLINEYVDKRSAIDLVHRCKDDWYEFIELKVGSNTPLFAAMEILQYGLLYAFSRFNLNELGYTEQHNPLLYGKGIRLKVLAPDEYYKDDSTDTRYELGWIEKKINEGLKEFLSSRNGDFNMTFSFESFTSREQWLKDPARNRSRIYAVHS